MDLILLPGNSGNKKEWIMSVEKEFKDLFDSTYVHYYKHWETGEKNIDFNYELEKLSKLLKGKKDYVIFGKSAGAVLAIKGIYEGKIHPKSCMFTGIPLNWCNNLNVPLMTWIKNYSVASYFIQKAKDPYMGADELKKFLKKNNVKNFKLIEIPGDNHDYENVRELKKLMKDLIFSTWD